MWANTTIQSPCGDQVVHDEPGVTRDRTYVPAFWRDRDFLVVDTGLDDDTEFYHSPTSNFGTGRSKCCYFLWLMEKGPTFADEEIAEWLRQTTRASAASCKQM